MCAVGAKSLSLSVSALMATLFVLSLSAVVSKGMWVVWPRLFGDLGLWDGKWNFIKYMLKFKLNIEYILQQCTSRSLDSGFELNIDQISDIIKQTVFLVEEMKKNAFDLLVEFTDGCLCHGANMVGLWMWVSACLT